MPGELTHDSDNMGKGFEDMDDASPFLAEPTYDPRYGGWLSKEMRAHLKILQTGTAEQVDLRPGLEENPPPVHAGESAAESTPQLTGEQSGGTAEGEPLVDVLSAMKIDDHLSAMKNKKDVATQCMLIGDPLERVLPVASFPRGRADADPTNDPGVLVPSTVSDGDLEELARSCNLIRLSRSIAWSQREWLPFNEE